MDDLWQAWNDEDIGEEAVPDEPERRAVGPEPVVKYTLRRRGSFHVVVLGDSHCSALEVGVGAVIRYEVMVECFDTDRRGFVFAQEEIEALFVAIGETRLSCESLAAKCARELRDAGLRQIEDQRLRVKVVLSPPPYVGSVTAEVGSLD